MDRNNIDKIAQMPEDRLLLAKLWDKIHGGIRKNILANTGFLSPREQEMCRYLFGDVPGLSYFGGCEDAERKVLVYLPDYLESTCLLEEDSPITALRAVFYEKDSLSHRDFLGAIMGAGITRDCVGDIYPGIGYCDFFVTTQIAPYVLQNLTSAGRTRIQLTQIPISQIQLPSPEVKEIRDTLASLRLDSIVASGFRIGRSLACQYITAGKAAINGLPCEKPDKNVDAGDKISIRGLGKIKLEQVNGATKKGRISILIHRYL